MEMLVFIAVFSLVMGMLFEAISFLYRVHGHQFASSIALSDATRHVHGITREVRSAVYGDDGSYPLVMMASTSLIFYADIDGDVPVERVRYRLTGETLERGIIEPTSTSSYPQSSESFSALTSGVHNIEQGVPLFRYYDASGVELTSSSGILDVRVVSVELHLTSGAGRQITDSVIRSGASIRNLRSQY